MKTVRGKALKLIMKLVYTTDSVTGILRRCGIPKSTYYGRWLRDPVFLEKLAEERADFESSLRGKFVSKRHRIEELERLYDKTPLIAEEFWYNGALKRVWLNISEKRATLKQIREEMEGLDVRLGASGAAENSDVVDRPQGGQRTGSL